MVTHEADIASYARRDIVMRDGLVRSDEPVTSRLKAREEQSKLASDEEPNG